MRIVMMGTGTFAEPTFEALLASFAGEVVGLVTQPSREGGQRRGSTRQVSRGMAAIAREAGVPVIDPPSINAPDGLAQLQDLQPDLLVVAAYGQILSPQVLAIPTLAAINVHASLLPKYRGAAPVAYAIWKGETVTGVSIIKITPGLDSGEVLMQESLAIKPEETAGELEARLAQLGARLAVAVIQRIHREGLFPGTPQDPALVTKAPKLRKEDGLIDWHRPAREICCQVRAMQPWPTAYTFLHRPGKEPLRLLLLAAAEDEALPDAEAAEPGMILPAPPGQSRLRVRAGPQPDGLQGSVVEIRELQPAGKKRMTAEEFLRGHPVTAGMRLGPDVPA